MVSEMNFQLIGLQFSNCANFDMAPIRKYPSGAQKKKEKQRREALVKLQVGSLSKFFTKQGEASRNTVVIEEAENENSVEIQGAENEEHNQVMNEYENEGTSQAMDDNESEEQIQHTEEADELVNEEKESEEPLQPTEEASEEDAVYSFDVDDPANWDKIKNNVSEFLVERGPKRVDDIIFPIDNSGRHFASSHYIRIIPNGEKKDRRWLVYSKALDKVYCFCCKLFKQDHNKNLVGMFGPASNK